jgi:hypothetical protein
VLSKAVGRPVQVQGMRCEGRVWDPKGPASIHRARAALDQDGAVIGYVFGSKGSSRIDIHTNESDPAYSLAGQLMGRPLKSLQCLVLPTGSYAVANKPLGWETIAPLLDRASPLRTWASARPGRPAGSTDVFYARCRRFQEVGPKQPLDHHPQVVRSDSLV